jgi:PPOX class probable F420-dependent enzyme
MQLTDSHAEESAMNAVVRVVGDSPEMRARVVAMRVARLATTDAAGETHLVPICFVLEGDVLYSAVDEKPKRSKRLKRLANIRAHPGVTVLVDHYEEDWSRLWWVRLRGEARVLEEGPERDRALLLLAAKYDQYRAQPPTGPVIAVEVEEWRAWSAAPGEGDL